jgi:hypothetical protein
LQFLCCLIDDSHNSGLVLNCGLCGFVYLDITII